MLTIVLTIGGLGSDLNVRQGSIFYKNKRFPFFLNLKNPFFKAAELS